MDSNISAPRSLELVTRSARETEEIGSRVAERCVGGEVIALIGDLGAGKTRFVKGLARGLGIDPDRVTSPTFVLHQRYAGSRLRLEHVDAYRLASAEDWVGLGLDGALGDGWVLAVEWADRVSDSLPNERLDVALEQASGGRRRIVLRAHGKGASELLGALER